MNSRRNAGAVIGFLAVPFRVVWPLAAFAVLLGSNIFFAIVAPQVAAQDDAECPTEEEINESANAIVRGKVIDVRTGGSSTAGNEDGDDSVIVEVLGIEKGGAQNPLAVFYPGEELPEISADTEIDIALTYDLETARAESSITCAYTLYSNGDSIAPGSSSSGTLGETAGETLTQAVQTVGLAGAAVIAATFIWRMFREFRPRLT